MRLRRSKDTYLKYPDEPVGDDTTDTGRITGAKLKGKQRAAPVTTTAPSASTGRGVTAASLCASFRSTIQVQFGTFWYRLYKRLADPCIAQTTDWRPSRFHWSSVPKKLLEKKLRIVGWDKTVPAPGE